MKIEEINRLIRERHAVYPPQYISKSIAREEIETLLENANWAPTHRMTEPWRFKVFREIGLEKLGDFMAENYRKQTGSDDFSVAKYEKLKTNPRKSGAVIAICLHRDIEERVPEWEEIAAVACAVQNMWLTAAAMNLGAYWSSPPLIDQMGAFLGLAANERCLGLFYLGHTQPHQTRRTRKSIGEKTEWIE